MCNMGSAHPLVEINISAKFEDTIMETDGQTDERDKAIHYSPPHILWWGYNYFHRKQIDDKNKNNLHM